MDAESLFDERLEKQFPPKMVNMPGMSLRDYFAGQALMGMYSTGNAVSAALPQTAQEAYRAADAMLAERDKTVNVEKSPQDK